MKTNEKDFSTVNGGAGKATGKFMLVCCNCGFTEDPKMGPQIQFGEMTACPKCKQVTMMLKKIAAE